MDRDTLIKLLDSLCWSARRWGHDDYGLDYGVDLNGARVADEEEDSYHPEAVEYADRVLALINT